VTFFGCLGGRSWVGVCGSRELLFDAQRGNRTWVVEGPSPELCRIVPDYRIFPLSLAFAFIKFRGRLAVCGNPKCKHYFIRPRKTQKFCERKECLMYGQQKQKREWWKEHGAEWREKRAHHQLGLSGRSSSDRKVSGTPRCHQHRHAPITRRVSSMATKQNVPQALSTETGEGYSQGSAPALHAGLVPAPPHIPACV
jgi:hypothetical protein